MKRSIYIAVGVAALLGFALVGAWLGGVTAQGQGVGAQSGNTLTDTLILGKLAVGSEAAVGDGVVHFSGTAQQDEGPFFTINCRNVTWNECVTYFQQAGPTQNRFELIVGGAVELTCKRGSDGNNIPCVLNGESVTLSTYDPRLSVAAGQQMTLRPSTGYEGIWLEGKRQPEDGNGQIFQWYTNPGRGLRLYGPIQIEPNSPTKPTCNEETRGTLWPEFTDTRDRLWACLKRSAGIFGWVPLAK